MSSMERERDKTRDEMLDAVVGKQVAAAWVTSHEDAEQRRKYDVLHLRLSDGFEVDIASSDSEGFCSWLELGT